MPVKNIPKAAGVIWYKNEDDYKRALSVFEDHATMPATYKDFLVSYALAFKEAEKRGFVAVKAEIDINAFIAWCKGRGINANRQARLLYANEAAADYLRARGFIK